MSIFPHIPEIQVLICMVRPMEKCLDCADTKGEVFTPEQFSYVGKKKGRVETHLTKGVNNEANKMLPFASVN